MMRLLSGFALSLVFLAPSSAAPPPVTALAYRPDGKSLAVAVRGDVVLVDPASGTITARFSVQTGQVTAVAWSRDGNWLALAGGAASKSGEVRLCNFADRGSASMNAVKSIPAHTDLIHELAFSPDGKYLATCSYDRLVKIWNVSTGKLERELKDHSDAVYGVAFASNGQLLATGAADRAVKIWDVATGKRLYTLGDSTDWVQAVAWHPDGKHVAAAGVDKSIRVWQADAREGKLVHSVFAHEKPVLKLVYSTDGKTLFSVGEDRVVKIWDAATLKERKVFSAQSESVLSMAVRADGKQLAIGRYDGACLILDVESGKVLSQPLPAKPMPAKLEPSFGPRGQKLRMAITGQNLQDVSEIQIEPAGVVVQIIANGIQPDRIVADVMFPSTASAGVYNVRLKHAGGTTNPLPFTLDLFAVQMESTANDAPGQGAKLNLPATVAGSLERAGDVDYYRVELSAGQELGVQAFVPPGSKLDPVLSLTDVGGTPLVESSAALGFKAKIAGTYIVGLRDREYRGGGEFSYRLHAGPIPIVTRVFPLGVQRGTRMLFSLDGVFLSSKSTVIKAPPDADIGSKLPIQAESKLGTPLGSVNVVVGEFPESVQGRRMPVPGTHNAKIENTSGAVVEFWGEKDQPLSLDVEARRLGSSLDPVLEILGTDGKPFQRAVLRCVAKTNVTFRDHDSAGSGIRMDTWNEFAIDDYVMVGNELMRIRALPKNPDDDCQFYAVGGQRVGYLGTTPSHHALGTPMFKVSIHPPGSTFPPNGMPLFPIYWRNDDGGAGFGKDSKLIFTPPADGVYYARVRDARGQSGSDYAFRLTIREPRPDFAVRFNPTAPSVWRGGSLPITVTVDRFDEFAGPVQVRLDNLPPGFSAPATFVEGGQTSTAFALFADATAKNPNAKQPPIKLVATATIAGKSVTKEVTGGVPKVVEPGDIVTTTSSSVVKVRPGHEARLLVHVERRNGFKGRIPIEVTGLPHGIRVLDIGLNGILITERDTAREIVIYAEPWVKPMEHPIVVLAKREGKNTEHGAGSVLLRVEK